MPITSCYIYGAYRTNAKGHHQLGVLTPEELVRQWATEQIPAEHAIGQLVQHLARLQRTLDTQRAAIAQMQTTLAHLQVPPTPSAPRNAIKGKTTG